MDGCIQWKVVLNILNRLRGNRINRMAPRRGVLSWPAHGDILRPARSVTDARWQPERQHRLSNPPTGGGVRSRLVRNQREALSRAGHKWAVTWLQFGWRSVQSHHPR